MNRDKASAEHRASSGAFPTTQWSLVVHASSDATVEVRAALESLCRNYWYPIYAFVRRLGRAHHEAEDCTQDFLARMLANDAVARARPELGRFRTFLLTALRHFLTNEWQRAHTLKRGGGQVIVSLDLERAEARFSHEPVDRELTPEEAFDRNWAIGMIERAYREIGEEYRSSGRGEVFASLGPLVWSDSGGVSIAEPAARPGMTVHAGTMALHRLRRRLGERVRTIVAETVAETTGGGIDEELRYLISIVRR